MDRMRVIACGGRDYNDAPTVEFVIGLLPRTATVIHGAARGADELAHAAATSRGLDIEQFPADWQTLGKAAGPERNRRMLASGADLLIAFPGGNGTRHMTNIARREDITVMQIS